MRKQFATLLLLGTASWAAPAIGVVRASGHFTLEGSEVFGNSTLFDGAVLETANASSDLTLENGVRVQLSKGSRARVWSNRLALERGAGQFWGGYEIEAAGLRILTPAGSRVRVKLGPGLEVAALTGVARVANPAGALIAAVPSGRSLSFAMQAVQSGSVMRAGCLVYKNGQYLLQDDASQTIAEVHGPDLALNLGNRVEVTGALASTRPTVAPATEYINVTGVAPRSQGGCLGIAAALNAQTSIATEGAKAPVAGGGMSTGAKVAIVAAIAGGGAGAAIAASSGKKSTSP